MHFTLFNFLLILILLMSIYCVSFKRISNLSTISFYDIFNNIMALCLLTKKIFVGV